MGTKQKNYICLFCSKSFSRSEHKARHERSHTGVKPFECKVCRHAFVRRDLLQRHIKTVHRDLLLMKRKTQQEQPRDCECSGDAKNDLYLELLVNSMIRVTNEAPNSVAGAVAQRRDWKKKTFDFDGENADQVLDLFVKYASTADITTREIRFFYNIGLQKLLSVDPWSETTEETHSERLLAIVCVGSFVNEQRRNDIWQICWSNIRDIVALDMMCQGIALYDHVPPDMGLFFQKFQRVYSDTRVSKAYQLRTLDCWAQLLRRTAEPDSVSSLILENVVNSELFGSSTAKHILTASSSSSQRFGLKLLNYLSEVLYCDWIIFHKFKISHIFKNRTEFHNALVMVNNHYYKVGQEKRQQRKQRKLRMRFHYRLPLSHTFGALLNRYSLPIQSDGHWLLLETFWFEFMDEINTHDQIWFTETITPIDISAINENLSICALPILAMLHLQNQRNIVPRYHQLIADVITFLLKIFGSELSISNLSFRPNRIFKLLSLQSIQALLVFEHLTIFRYSEENMFDIDHFVNEFILNQNKNDSFWKIQSNFLDAQSSIFTGYCELIKSIIEDIKEKVIEEMLLDIPNFSREVKSRLSERALDAINSYTAPVHSFQRVTEPWKFNYEGVFSPVLIKSMQIRPPLSSPANDYGFQSVGMRQASSVDSASFRQSNIILPPLNFDPMRRRSSLDYPLQSPPLLKHNYQQYNVNFSNPNGANNFNNTNVSNIYSYGPEPISPKTIPQNIKMSPTYTTPFIGHAGSVASPMSSSMQPMNIRATSAGSLYNSSESPPSYNGIQHTFNVNNVRLPPPSELFSVSST